MLVALPARTEPRSKTAIAERQRAEGSARRGSSALAATIGRDSRPHRRAPSALQRRSPGDAASFDRPARRCSETQAYRLAYWRTAFDEINYRRFFDVNDLAALRMEDPRVFDASAPLLLDLVAEGRDHRDSHRSPGRPVRSSRVSRSSCRRRGE